MGKAAVKDECTRCKQKAPEYIRGMCPTCRALCDAASDLIARRVPAKQRRPSGRVRKNKVSDETRKQRSEHMKEVNRRRKAGEIRTAGGAQNPVTQLAGKVNRGQKPIPEDVMAELAARGLADPKPVITSSDPQFAVQRELAERELARRSLLRFIVRQNPQYLAGWFHRDLCERVQKFFEDCDRGLSPRLMIFAPPRSGKSKIVSEEAPAFAFGQFPNLEIIASSYGSDLARDFSYKVQERIRSENFQTLFPKTRLRPGKESVDTWRLDKYNGTYMAVGVGGPMTGRGANCLIIDDPFKNREEADSETIRQSVWNWYTSTAYTRLAPGGGVLLMHTRWHDDDLAGRLLAEMAVAEKQMADTGEWPADADRWELVSYPAIATTDEKHRKVGEALHPERYNLNALLKIKRTLGPRDWSALYQQTPVPDEGGYFNKSHFRFYDSAPSTDSLAIYCAGDLAISKKESADFTVFVIAGLDRDGNVWLLDLIRGRFDSLEIIQQLFNIHKKWRPKLIGLEEGAIATAIGPFLEKRMQEERMYELRIEPLKIKKQDKEARARAIQGRMAQGKVMIPRNADWTSVLVEELVRFPTAVRNDCVDALAWIGQMLMLMNVDYAPQRKLPSWRDKLNEIVNPSGRALGMMAA